MGKDKQKTIIQRYIPVTFFKDLPKFILKRNGIGRRRVEKSFASLFLRKKRQVWNRKSPNYGREDSHFTRAERFDKTSIETFTKTRLKPVSYKKKVCSQPENIYPQVGNRHSHCANKYSKAANRLSLTSGRDYLLTLD